MVEKRLRMRNGCCTACTPCTARHCNVAKLVHLCSVVWGGVSMAWHTCRMGVGCLLALLGKTQLWAGGAEQRRETGL